MVQDYQKLNVMTVMNTTPSPGPRHPQQSLKPELILHKAGHPLGYNNGWIKEGEEWKAAF